jgi:hypothetical protein
MNITEEMWSDLLRRVDMLETGTAVNVRLGPQPKQDAELERDRERIVKQLTEKSKQDNIPPVDYGARILVDGSPIPEDSSHKEINPRTGQQKDYIVLTPEERSKGFVRPVRRSYKHLPCGGTTTMAQAIAETFARSPEFYSGGFCATCRSHFPNDQFVWPDDGTTVGS